LLQLAALKSLIFSSRFSHHGRISHFDSEGYPLNCGGRTGIDGRGSLVSSDVRFCECILGSHCCRETGDPIMQLIPWLLV
jgi:hypothetical protein